MRKHHLLESLQKGRSGGNFDYTAPGMPQQNGQVKKKLATLFNQVFDVPDGGKFNAYLQNEKWAKAANNTMLLENN